MELLLNLLWLLLALPAWWVWRRQDRSFDSLRCVLVLACALVLLFPVISATDDLQAMRQEMEESTPSKRTLKQAGIENSSVRSHFTAPPARLAASVLLPPCFEIFGRVSAMQAPAPVLALARVASGRSPPSFLRA
jgi:HAMP domain-containing protein